MIRFSRLQNKRDRKNVITDSVSYSFGYGTLVFNMYAYWQVSYREVGLPKLCTLVLSLISHHGAENSNYMRRVG